MVQVDFDDGHCPSWSNQLRGWHNVQKFALGRLTGLSLKLIKLFSIGLLVIFIYLDTIISVMT